MRRPTGRKLHSILIAALALSLLAGCGKGDTVITETVIDTVDSSLSEDRGITVYKVEGRSVVAEGEKFQPKQPDSVASSLEETMDVIPLTEGIKFLGYTMGENNSVTMNFQVGEQVSKETLLLEKAAVVSTVEQVRNIGTINLSLLDPQGKVLEEGTFTSKSFYYYDDVIPTGQNNGQITLFLPEEGGKGLTEMPLSVTLQLDVSVEEEVVNQLIERGVFAEGTRLISITVTQKIAYVDLSEEVLNTTDKRAVYALVDSICTLPHITGIKILVNGEKQESIAGVDTHVPLQFIKVK